MLKRYIQRSFSTRPFSLLTSLLLILILAGCGSKTVTSITLAKPTPTHTSVVTPTPTATLTATPTSINATTPTATTAASRSTPAPTTHPAAFNVVGVSVSVSPKTTCRSDTTFTYSATITVPSGTQGGTVSYTWLRFDNVPMPTQSLTFNPGETEKTVTTTWQKNWLWTNGAQYWEALQVTSPNTLTSAKAIGTFTCDRTVTGSSASVTPTVYPCSQSAVAFPLAGTITITSNSDAEDVVYEWQVNGQTYGTPIDVVVPAGQTQITTAPISWTTDLTAPNQTFEIKLVTITPNGFSSSPATVTKNC